MFKMTEHRKSSSIRFFFENKSFLKEHSYFYSSVLSIKNSSYLFSIKIEDGRYIKIRMLFQIFFQFISGGVTPHIVHSGLGAR